MSQVVEQLYTEEEYLRVEDKSEERHEYVNGVLRLMAGGTKTHNILIQNFVIKLALLARAKACELFLENVRVKLPVGSKRNYYYPDGVVTCKPSDGDQRTVKNPYFVVEVLSDSTAEVDRVEKLETYQRIASIKQYILVDQTRRKIEIYTRHGEAWIYKMLEAGSFNIAYLETTMTLDDVYAGSTFESTESETNK
jgi:Uma2 family endonuclease